MWYKIFDFDIFKEDSYIYQLIKAGYEIPIIPIEWKFNNGDYVKAGDILFICVVNNDFYKNSQGEFFVLHDGICIFYSPVDGFLYRTLDKAVSFRLRKNTPICAVYKTIEEYDNALKYVKNGININDYKDYPLFKEEYSVRIHCHPSINTKSKKLKSIVSWLFAKDNIYGSYGKNEQNGFVSYFYINNDFSIDCIVDSFSCLVRKNNSLPDYVIFRNVSGDFKISFIEISDNDIVSLSGCPKIVYGNFDCSRCHLINFKNTPRYIGEDFIIKSNKLISFIGMPNYIGGCFNFANNELTDEAWEYCRDYIDGEFCDYNHNGNKFIKYRKKLY